MSNQKWVKFKYESPKLVKHGNLANLTRSAGKTTAPDKSVGTKTS